MESVILSSILTEFMTYSVKWSIQFTILELTVYILIFKADVEHNFFVSVIPFYLVYEFLNSIIH